MASVWVARLRGKRGFEKLVAIKTILPKYAQDPRFERMFLDEAGLAARIEHNNVAQVLDLGEEHEVLYLTMELVDGDSLSKLLRVVDKKKLKIPTGVILRILADTCGGLHAAHEVRGRDGELLNVVHRDISPQNILVTMGGVAKLIDFGIAKARDRVSEDTSEGMLKGKIHFMAPEQALSKGVDRRADVWAVGAILYFLLAGKPPFAGENELASLFLLSSGRPPLPLPPTVHPAVSAVVKRALSHDLDKRYATAADLQAALEEAMVSANLVTTTANVAAFVQEHMADRARRRKEGMDLALSAAAQREKVASMLEKAGHDSSSGHGQPGTASGAIAAVDATYATVLLGPASRRDIQPAPSTREPTSETSSATLGAAAAMASPVPEDVLPRPRKFGLLVAVLVAVPAIAVGIGLAARPSSKAKAAASPPPTVTTVTTVTTATVPGTASIPPVPPVPSAGAGDAAPAGSASSSGLASSAPSVGATTTATTAPTAPALAATVKVLSKPAAPAGPGAQSRPSRPVTPAATSGTPVKTRVNDGF